MSCQSIRNWTWSYRGYKSQEAHREDYYSLSADATLIQSHLTLKVAVSGATSATISQGPNFILPEPLLSPFLLSSVKVNKHYRKYEDGLSTKALVKLQREKVQR